MSRSNYCCRFFQTRFCIFDIKLDYCGLLFLKLHAGNALWSTLYFTIASWIKLYAFLRECRPLLFEQANKLDLQIQNLRASIKRPEFFCPPQSLKQNQEQVIIYQLCKLELKIAQNSVCFVQCVESNCKRWIRWNRKRLPTKVRFHLNLNVFTAPWINMSSSNWVISVSSTLPMQRNSHYCT